MTISKGILVHRVKNAYFAPPIRSFQSRGFLYVVLVRRLTSTLENEQFHMGYVGQHTKPVKKLGRMRSMSKEVAAIAYELRSRRILYRSASTEKVVQEFHEDQLGSEILWSPKLACKIEFFRNKNTSHTIKMSWTSGPCHMKMPFPGPNSYFECQDTCFVITWQSIVLELRSGLMKSPITSITTYNHL